MANATISAGYPAALLTFAVSRGAHRKELLARAGLAEADLEQQDRRVAIDRYVALIEAAAELTGEPAIALQFGEAVRMQDISIVGLICEACETTADVGRQLNRYARLVVDDDCAEPGAYARGVRRDGGFWIEAAHPVFEAHPQIAEAELARLVWNARVMFANAPEFQKVVWPRAVHFMHADRGYAIEYSRVFRAPVVFNAGWNAIQIDEAFLALRQPPVNRYVFGVLSERADALLQGLLQARTMRGQVEAKLASILHTGEAGMDEVARRLGVSRQTLYRRLKAEGVTFDAVLDDLRRRLAVSYLAGRRVSVNETAYLVGFSDPAAFSRAFKRWTGKSPVEVRRQG